MIPIVGQITVRPSRYVPQRQRTPQHDRDRDAPYTFHDTPICELTPEKRIVQGLDRTGNPANTSRKIPREQDNSADLSSVGARENGVSGGRAFGVDGR